MASTINASTSSGLVQSGDTSGVLQLQTNSGQTAVTIDTSQNVGIGTTSPSAKFQTKVGTNANAAFDLHGSNPRLDFFNDAASANVFAEIQALGLAFNTISGGEAMRIDSSGNVGIGTTSPASKLDVNGAIRSTSGTTLLVASVTGGIPYIQGYDGTTSANNQLAFYTGSAERMRIDSSGNVLAGCTVLPSTGGASSYGMAFERGISVAGNTTLTFRASATTAIDAAYFYTSAALVGYIRTSGSTTTYSTTSDYRLKENIAPMTGALEKVALLKPVTYTWKNGGETGQGFIAHELQAVVPECVGGEKDAVDEEGNPVYQGVDTSFLVATLTAAIQEQQTIINDLKARITALEGAK